MSPKEMNKGSVDNLKISATKNSNHCLAVLDKKKEGHLERNGGRDEEATFSIRAKKKKLIK